MSHGRQLVRLRAVTDLVVQQGFEDHYCDRYIPDVESNIHCMESCGRISASVSDKIGKTLGLVWVAS